MRLRRAQKFESEQTGIDLAPMLDFVLNLLIFFIITAVFVKEVGLTVSRPSASTAEQKESGTILIAIQANGDIFMDRRVVDVRQVRATVERLHALKPEDPVVVIPEAAAPTGVLVQVIDQVRQGGIRNVSIAPTAAPAGG